MNLATFDFETDPFLHGRVPQPFAAGIKTKNKYVSFWGDDCVQKMTAYLDSLPEPHICYAHNGGKFDFFYLLDKLSSGLRIVNGRIIQANLGKHEIRDSYAVLPFALRKYKKDDIDYEKLERTVRKDHREEILSYLQADCEYLFELVIAFWQEFGNNLTIGGTAMKQLKRFHKFKSGNEIYDAKFRRDFYFGGRVQCFVGGEIRQTCNVYDVNAMYPYVMSAFLHPISTGHTVSKSIEENTCFVVAEGHNYGAFPVRKPQGGLDFDVKQGIFCTTIHEWNAAIETKTFRPRRILKAYNFIDRDSFADFVFHYYDARRQAKSTGDKTRDLFYKYVLNSAYGKFAQNPDNYADYQIASYDEIPPEGWTEAYSFQGKYVIWKRPTEQHRYYNICTAASITGASRAILLRGLVASKKALYCDTDSIICESIDGITNDPDALGAWKLECAGDRAFVAGKKLYAIMSGDTCVKKAHKGARLTPAEIACIARGGEVRYVNHVPSFKLDGKHLFLERNIRRTA